MDGLVGVFFQQEVATGLQLAAQAIDDSDFAMALRELMGAHLLSLRAEQNIAPYTLSLVYQGKRRDGTSCYAHARLDTDGSIVGLGVSNGYGIKEKYVAFSFLGLRPLVKSEHLEVDPGKSCLVFHPSLRATLGERIFSNQKMSFHEDDLKITAEHIEEWQDLHSLDRGCGSKTVTIEACDGRVKGTISKTSDRMTAIGPFSDREVNEFECNDLKLFTTERGHFISDEVFTKVIQRPIFGRAPLSSKR